MRGGALGGLVAAGLAAGSTLALSAPAWANTLQVQGGYSQARTLALRTRPKPDPQWPKSLQQEFISMLEGSGVSPAAAACMDNIMILTYPYKYYLQHNEAQSNYWVTTYWPQMSACVARYPA
jgi:hypothetical protein